MRGNDKRTSDFPSSSTRSAPLKGSDYFPPGAGWNRKSLPDESTQQYPADKNPADREKHH